MLPKKLLLNRSSEILSDMAPFGIVVTCWWPLGRIGSMKIPSNNLHPLPWPPHTPQASIVAPDPTTPSHPTGWTTNMWIFSAAAISSNFKTAFRRCLYFILLGELSCFYIYIYKSVTWYLQQFRIDLFSHNFFFSSDYSKEEFLRRKSTPYFAQ